MNIYNLKFDKFRESILNVVYLFYFFYQMNHKLKCSILLQNTRNLYEQEVQKEKISEDMLNWIDQVNQILNKFKDIWTVTSGEDKIIWDAAIRCVTAEVKDKWLKNCYAETKNFWEYNCKYSEITLTDKLESYNIRYDFITSSRSFEMIKFEKLKT